MSATSACWRGNERKTLMVKSRVDVETGTNKNLPRPRRIRPGPTASRFGIICHGHGPQALTASCLHQIGHQ